MTRLALLAVTLFSLIEVTGVIWAQPVAQTPAPLSRKAVPSSAAEQSPPMTPRQIAEMRADILVARKEYAMAVEAYERILRNDRKNSALLNKVGMAYQQLDNPGKAEHYYKLAWKYDKHFAGAMNNLGTVEYGKRHYKNAIKDYRRALKVGTDMATIYSNLGFAYCGRKDYRQATIAFSRAIAIDPTIFDHHGDFGSVFLQRSAPDQATIYFMMARSYAKMGDVQQTAHYLKLARDTGYKHMHAALTDAAFKRVIGNPLVQEVVRTPAPFGISNRTEQD
jgi:tetratricopeptide (TPR) repeat protein